MKHAFRNALIPVITVVSLSLPGIISGSILVEQVFSYPGMGQLFFRATGGCVGSATPGFESPCPPFGAPPDPVLSLGLVFVMVIIVSMASMLADILYVASDPRIDPGKQAK